MSFLDLPNEILLVIASPLGLQDINSLLRVNRRLTSLLTEKLHSYATLPRSVLRPSRAPIHCTLHWAAWKGYDGLFRLLLEKGFHTDCSHYGEHLIHFAARGGSKEIVRLLLDKGANVNAPSSSEETPLHYAVHAKNESMVRLLLEHGASVTPSIPITLWTSGRSVAVVGPAAQMDASILRLLLLRGAPIDARDPATGATALHQAVRYGNLEIVETLLRQRASTETRCNMGQTAFEWALQWRRGQIIKLFQKEGLVPLLGGMYYDEREPKGRLEYWRLACGEGRRNKLRALWRAFAEGDPNTGASNKRRLDAHCKRCRSRSYK